MASIEVDYTSEWVSLCDKLGLVPLHKALEAKAYVKRCGHTSKRPYASLYKDGWAFELSQWLEKIVATDLSLWGENRFQPLRVYPIPKTEEEFRAILKEVL